MSVQIPEEFFFFYRLGGFVGKIFSRGLSWLCAHSRVAARAAAAAVLGFGATMGSHL